MTRQDLGSQSTTLSPSLVCLSPCQFGERTHAFSTIRCVPAFAALNSVQAASYASRDVSQLTLTVFVIFIPLLHFQHPLKSASPCTVCVLVVNLRRCNALAPDSFEQAWWYTPVITVGMQSQMRLSLFALLLLLVEPLYAQSACATSYAPSGSIRPSVASGYTWAVVATGLTLPRSLELDHDGNLFVLEQNKGLSKHVLQDDGGVCVSVKSSTDIIDDVTLTHGLAIQGSTIYVSSSNTAYRVSYNAAQSKIVANTNHTIVTDMEGTDHVTRTLLIPDGMNSIIVSRGSIANIDPQAGSESSGHSTVKIFSLDNVPNTGYVHNTSGRLLGWGLRNDVGLAVHPTTGGIWTVENSVDQLTRDGKDVHQDNPGEELNFLGYLNGTDSPSQGSDFGYPYCFTAWKPSDMPSSGAIQVGSPFSPQSSNDSACAKTTAPRLTFQAHMAPLDIKFNNSAKEAWVSFHGSWDRTDPGK